MRRGWEAAEIDASGNGWWCSGWEYKCADTETRAMVQVIDGATLSGDERMGDHRYRWFVSYVDDDGRENTDAGACGDVDAAMVRCEWAAVRLGVDIEKPPVPRDDQTLDLLFGGRDG